MAVITDTANGQPSAAAPAGGPNGPAPQAAGLNAEPSWIYAAVIGFLGVALLALVIAMIIASLTGKGNVSTDIVSAATLIIGGLIGVLAPTPATTKPKRPAAGALANGSAPPPPPA